MPLPSPSAATLAIATVRPRRRRTGGGGRGCELRGGGGLPRLADDEAAVRRGVGDEPEASAAHDGGRRLVRGEQREAPARVASQALRVVRHAQAGRAGAALHVRDRRAHERERVCRAEPLGRAHEVGTGRGSAERRHARVGAPPLHRDPRAQGAGGEAVELRRAPRHARREALRDRDEQPVSRGRGIDGALALGEERELAATVVGPQAIEEVKRGQRLHRWCRQPTTAPTRRLRAVGQA